MAKIEYKTRGNSSPQGKSRVYFFAHPDDYDQYFEEIAEDILNYQNCTIWYDTESEDVYDEEELFSSLSQMQLFVVPVTSKFLYTRNRALDVEFRFAIKHHIPVLPLMQEAGLERKFNEICGDLQFLDKNMRDETAISYNEKLKQFLDSILIGDELAQKIRAAFDAYIFLSYRKKDRKYAQELMRLIHKDEFCRDIAIWYDEFLVPGENFNQAIIEALKKSQLFVLTVTPNIVNEVNYIMTTEYPLALEEKKNIISAEILPTNKEELKEKYENIPECVDPYNQEEFSKAILHLLQEDRKGHSEPTPEHDFFIGLAYLGGIDVEVNHERAFELITKAANEGLSEAMKKLVNMYQTGEGVERNINHAVNWQIKLVQRKKEEFEATEDEKTGYEYISECLELGDCVFSWQQLDMAEGAYVAALRAVDEVMKKYQTITVMKYSEICSQKLGNTYRKQGKLDKAEKCYMNCLEMCRIFEKINDKDQEGKAIAHKKLGDIARDKSDYVDAEMHYSNGLRILLSIQEEENATDMRRGIMVLYTDLAKTYIAREELIKGQEYLKKSLDLSLQLNEEVQTVESKRDLSISYRDLGENAKYQEKWGLAEEYYEKSYEIDKKLFEETGTWTDFRALAIDCIYLGDAYRQKKDLRNAKNYYNAGMENFLQLSKVSSTEEIKNDLILCYERLGDIYRELGEDEKAGEYYLKSLGYGEKEGTEKEIESETKTRTETRKIEKESCFEEEWEDDWEDDWKPARRKDKKGIKQKIFGWFRK